MGVPNSVMPIQVTVYLTPININNLDVVVNEKASMKQIRTQ